MLYGHGIWKIDSKMKKKTESGNELGLAIMLVLLALIIFSGFGMMGFGGYGMMGGSYFGHWLGGYLWHILFIALIIFFIVLVIKQLQD